MCHHLANKLCWLRYGSFESRDIPDQDSKKSFASFQGGREREKERAREREVGTSISSVWGHFISSNTLTVCITVHIIQRLLQVSVFIWNGYLISQNCKIFLWLTVCCNSSPNGNARCAQMGTGSSCSKDLDL
jgi:hypothetical protein